MTGKLIVIGIAAGLIFGILVACLNTYISKRFVKKYEHKESTENMASVMGLNFIRLMIDVVALAIVFFTRNIIPLPYEAVLVGTAIGLTVFSYLFLMKFLK